MYRLSRAILVVALMISGLFLAGAIADSWPASGWLLLLLGLAAAGGKSYTRLTTLGSARWADEDDLRKAGMLDAKSGLILGRLPGRQRLRGLRAIRWLFRGGISAEEACRRFLSAFAKDRGTLVWLPKAVHTLVVAPTNVGKSQSLVVPFLKTCPDSCVCVDYKGELAKLTAEHRRKHLGHQIVLLDPFHVVTDKPATFNPLDLINQDDPFAIDQVNALAKALVMREPGERDPHFNDAAEGTIAGVTAMVVQYGKASDDMRSLQTVREVLSNPQKLELAVKAMTEAGAWRGILARMGGQLQHFVDRERSSMLTTAGRHLRFLDSLPVLDSTTSSSFDPAKLRQGRMTLYLILPPDQQRVQAPLMRMWITSCLHAVVAGGLQEKNLVHFVLDEAASLGHLEVLEDMIDKYRGYGVRGQFYYQSMGQLKKCWPNGQDQTLLSNTTQIFFGVNDVGGGAGAVGSADYVSARLGEETIVVESSGRSKSTSSSYTSGGPQRSQSTSTSYSTNQNFQQQARRLCKPEEVIALPARTAITFTPGVPPIRTTLLRAYEEPRLGVRPSRFGRVRAAVGTFIASIAVGTSLFVTSLGFFAFVQDLRATRPAGAHPLMHSNYRQPGVPAAPRHLSRRS
jgi:type IV secretion system protein VirD4